MTDISRGIGLDRLNATLSQLEATATDTGSDIADTVKNLVADITDIGTADERFYTGTEGDDVFRVSDNNNWTINGLGGADTLIGGTGNDVISGGTGGDILDGGAGTDTLSYATSAAGVTVNLALNTARGGDAQGDVIANFENITGSNGNDVLIGDAGNNVILGGAGNDSIEGGAGADVLDGGEGGSDFLFYSGSAAGVNINIATNTASGGDAEGDVISNFEHVTGSHFDDVIVGNDGANVLSGQRGNDTISGAGGNDTINGGAGADILDGGEGNDTLTYATGSAGVIVNLTTNTASGGDAEGDVISNFENVIGSSGNDSLTGDDRDNILQGGAGADSLDGGAGEDTLSYELSRSGVTVDLLAGTASGGDAQGDSFTNFENVQGSAYNDLIQGNAAANRLHGGAGIDTLSYAGSNAGVTVNLELQTATGGHATGDVISGFENLTGSDFDDIVTGNASTNVLIGGAGNDSLSGYGGNDQITGGTGADIIDGGTGEDTAFYDQSDAAVSIDLTAGTASGGHATGDVLRNIENLFGSNFDDTLIGNGLANALIGSLGADTLSGLGGNDRIDGGQGADVMDGGDGNDTLYYTGSAAGVNINLGTGAASGGDADGDVFVNFENVIGSNFNDVLTGDDSANVIEGGAGADTLDGGLGSDTLSYSRSAAGVSVNLRNGTVSGGDAQGDVISGFENVTGSAFNDLIQGNASANVLNGGAGIDTLSYAQSAAGVIVNLLTNQVSGGDAQGDMIAGFENVVGSAFNDTITGNAGNNVIEGGAGADIINGGAGNDTASYASSNAGVNINLQTGTATGGHAANDQLISIENVTGSAFNDSFVGSDAANVLIGGAGDDNMRGSRGADTMDGGEGTNDTLNYVDSNAAVHVNLATNQARGGYAEGDIISGFESLVGSGFNDTLTGNDADNGIFGGDGNDVITGGAGRDSMGGNAGNDVFDFNAITDSVVGARSDLIFGFERGQDLIDLSTIDADTGTDGNQAFTFIGSGNFTGVAGQLRAFIGNNDGQSYVLADINGDGIADFQITLNGSMQLTASDFLL